MTTTARAFHGPEDLAAIARLVGDAWIADRPHVPFTITTLEWLMANQPADTPWAERIQLWEDDAGLAAVAWYWPVGNADGLVRADHQDGPVWDEVYAWQAAVAATIAGAPVALSRFAIDGPTAERARLERHGFRPTDLALSQFHHFLDGPPPPARIPDGYRVRTLAGMDEIPARVEVHRAAFAPSHMTVERYQRVVASPHYAMERDVVVEAPDGSLAAFTIAWLDPVARVGEFEPVGTHPDHRRRGLALAANRHALGLLYEAGARDIVVFSESDNAGSEALCAAAGFRRLATHRRWERPA